MARRYYTLDALRGVAAILVLAGHSRDWLEPAPYPRAWLAVDLFFLLSGFVISKAYDPRFQAGMTAKQFLVQRYARLYPLYAVGIGIGIVSGLLTIVAGRGTLTPNVYALSAFSGILMLPSPTWQSIDDLVPLNHPAWSLLFELLANILFAMGWRFLSGKLLPLIISVAGLALIASNFWGDPFAGPSWPHAIWAVPRVCFGFFLGVLIGRKYEPQSTKSSWAWAIPAFLFVPMYINPGSGPDAFTTYAKFCDALFVFVISPVLIMVGAKFEASKVKFMTFIGFVSYPLYAIHEPLLFFLWRILAALRISPQQIAPFGGIVFCAAMIATAWFLGLADQRLQRRIAPFLKKWSTPAA